MNSLNNEHFITAGAEKWGEDMRGGLEPYGMWSPAPRTEHFFFTFQIVQSNTPVGFSFHSQLVTFGSGVYRAPLTAAPCKISNNHPNDKNISINIGFGNTTKTIEHNIK